MPLEGAHHRQRNGRYSADTPHLNLRRSYQPRAFLVTPRSQRCALFIPFFRKALEFGAAVVRGRVRRARALRMSSGEKDPSVIVTNDGQRSAAGSVFESFLTFYRAPCLKQSLSVGFAGGVGIGCLRYFDSRHIPTAYTWGAVVGGLLYGTSWFVCRRALYEAQTAETKLLQRVIAQDPDAMREYQAKLEEKAARAAAKQQGP